MTTERCGTSIVLRRVLEDGHVIDTKPFPPQLLAEPGRVRHRRLLQSSTVGDARDNGLSAKRVYVIAGDFQAPRYLPILEMHWIYEAAKLWAKRMQAASETVPQAAE